MPLEPGSPLGPYEILSLIGRNGRGFFSARPTYISPRASPGQGCGQADGHLGLRMLFVRGFDRQDSLPWRNGLRHDCRHPQKRRGLGTSTSNYAGKYSALAAPFPARKIRIGACGMWGRHASGYQRCLPNLQVDLETMRAAPKKRPLAVTVAAFLAAVLLGGIAVWWLSRRPSSWSASMTPPFT